MMRNEAAKSSSPKASEPRTELGSWLKALRLERGLSQRQLADALSLDYYTFISQLETGRGKIPSSRYFDWAIALGQEPRAFMIDLLRFYEPEAYQMIFGAEEGEPADLPSL